MTESLPVSASLKRRTVAALIAAPFFLAAVVLGPQAVLLAVVVVSLLAAWEADLLFARVAGERASPPAAVAAAGLLLLLAYLDPRGYPAYLLLGLLSGWVLLRLGRSARQPPLVGGGMAILAGSYSAGLGAFLYLLRLPLQGLAWLMVVLLTTWANDTFAYLVGTWRGRRRLAPGISPHKSWEGAVAGWAGAVVVGLLSGAVLGISLGLAAGLGLVAGLAGTAGDLFESWLKRRAGTKDSGRFLPGHGGVLDRFDSLLFAAPFGYGLLVILGYV